MFPGFAASNAIRTPDVLPRALPAWVYNHPEVTRLELERIVLPSWQIACHVSALKQPGNFVTMDIGPESVVVLRDRCVLIPRSASCSYALPVIRHQLRSYGAGCWRFYSMLPNLEIDVYPEQMDFFQVLPDGPGKAITRGAVFGLPDSRREMRLVRFLSDRISRQVNRHAPARYS
jgi:phenylpropionate dioxygenase-like ring-hydroxylating dioxygenase large terminal subunit